MIESDANSLHAVLSDRDMLESLLGRDVGEVCDQTIGILRESECGSDGVREIDFNCDFIAIGGDVDVADGGGLSRSCGGGDGEDEEKIGM